MWIYFKCIEMACDSFMFVYFRLKILVKWNKSWGTEYFRITTPMQLHSVGKIIFARQKQACQS